jgi:NADH-quinone oxidoreductase subunit A
MLTSVAIAGYILLFFGLSGAFLAVNFFVGSFLRPNTPSKEKLEIYECGEPAIGSSFVQFDLRFYVVALLFIIFDVEVAFFFPWATVYGKATHLSNPGTPIYNADGSLTATASGLQQELGLTPVAAVDAASVSEATKTFQTAAQQLSFVSLCDILVFFAVLMVGFFYVWKRGDLDWVRAVSQERAQAANEIAAATRGGARSIFDREPAISP